MDFKKSLILLILFLPAYVSAEESLKVICVPWYNSYNAHQTWSGKEIILKGTVKRGTGTLKYQWDFGDGNSTITKIVTNPYSISATHTYKGSENTLFIATLKVTDGMNNTGTDSYRVRIREATTTVAMDIAIDNALWFLHSTQTRTIQSGTECGYWKASGFYVSPTAAAIEAFENQGRLPGGDRDEDPYVETIERGFNYLFTRCEIVTIGTQTAGDPDTNDNGIGIGIYQGQPIYEIGPMMMAIVGSRQPERVARTGPVINRTYREILQDMVDYCAWSQSDEGTHTPHGRGGWQYSPYNNQNGSSDNSATQWPVIGLTASATDPWNISAPQFLKDELKYWLEYSQNTNNGGFGYTSPSDPSAVRTGAGIADFAYLGYTATEEKPNKAINYLYNNWKNGGANFGNFYGMYAIMKGLRLIKLPSPDMLGDIEWYNEYVDYLLKNQFPDGHWEDKKDWAIYLTPSLSTAWGILILMKSLFSAPPVAIARINPQIIQVGKSIQFIGTNSYHLDPKRHIVKFEWDFGDGFNAPGSITTHTFFQPGVYSILLKVTDDNSTPLTGEDIIQIRALVAPATITISPGSVTIPVTKTMTITALVKDEFGNLADDGTIVDWSTIIGSITLSSPTINGIAIATYSAPTKVGTGTITAKVIGGKNPSDSIMVTVTSGLHHHFNFDHIGTQTAGTPFTITLTAVDFWNNPVLDFKDTVTLTNLNGEITPKTITDFKDGKYIGTVSVFKAGTALLIADCKGKKGVSPPFLVQPGEVSYFLFDEIGTQIAGIDFLIKITAYDNWGNTATTFSNSVNLSVQPYQSGNFKDGQWSGMVVIKKAGTTNITAMDNDKSGTSNTFLVKPNNFEFFIFATITTQIAGVGFPITITAYDAYDNIADYNNTAYLQDTSHTIAPQTTTKFTSGIWTGTVSINQVGTTVITVWSGTKTGMSNVFSVFPSDLSYISISPNTLELIVDAAAPLIAKGYDDHDNELANFECNWEVTENIGYFNANVGSQTIFTAGILVRKGIIKAFVGNIFATAGITILPGSLSYIIILPQATITVVTNSQPFKAKGFDKYANERVINGQWQMENGLGTLTHLEATSTTFVAGTKTGLEILTYKVEEITGIATITLISDVLDHFGFKPIEVQIAGQKFEIQITAYDKYGNIVESFNNSGELKDTTTTILPKTTSNFKSGTCSQEVVITTAMDNVTINIFSQGKTGISPPFTVLPAIVNHFKIDHISTQIWRTSFPATVTAYDIYENIADYNGAFNLTDTTNSINITRNFTAGIWTGTVSINKATPDVEITATDGVRTIKSNPFFVLIDDSKDEKIQEGNIAIDVARYFLPEDYYPVFIKDPPDPEVTTANYYTDKDTLVKRIPDTVYKIEGRNEQREILTEGFGTTSAFITITYSEADVSMVGGKELNLAIYELKNNRWVKIEDGVVNTFENKVTAPISRLGIYTLIVYLEAQDLSKFIVYPVPFKPSRGDDKIIFEGLPANSTIRIYDISGDLIRMIEDVSSIYEWDVKDSHSKDVASGVYIYIVTYGVEKKSGKLVIIR